MTTMMFNVDKKLKTNFSDFAKKLGTNPSNLMRMFMTHTINTKKVSFEIEPVLDLEFEPLDISDWGEDFIKKTEKNTRKLEKLLAKK